MRKAAGYVAIFVMGFAVCLLMLRAYSGLGVARDQQARKNVLAILDKTPPVSTVPDNSLVMLVVTPKGSARHVYGVLVFERHGAVLDGTYLQSATKPASAEVGAVVTLAIATGKRLALS